MLFAVTRHRPPCWFAVSGREVGRFKAIGRVAVAPCGYNLRRADRHKQRVSHRYSGKVSHKVLY